MKTDINQVLWSAAEALICAIDQSRNIGEHSKNVAIYSDLIAKELGWDHNRRDEVRLGALLHDIGQIFVPNLLTTKGEREVTPEERQLFKEHTVKGAQFIESWPMLASARPYVLYHQEWIDGSGYPFGLKGNEIPEEVQVVSIADVYEALSKPRGYQNREGLTLEASLNIMKPMSGVRWRADLFDAFITISQNCA